MTTKQVYLTVIALTLLISVLCVPLVPTEKPVVTATATNNISPLQDPEAEEISVSLVAPVTDTTIDDDFNVSFTFEPTISGDDNKFYGADLILNGSIVAHNQTAIVPDEENIIYYKFTENNTYTWNIGIRNSTHTQYAPEDFTITIEVPNPVGVAVTLKAPDNGTKVTNDLNCSFVFVPTAMGGDILKSATLIVNGSQVAYNQTDITADEDNTIYYKFSANNTYRWNIRLYNTSTSYVTAAEDYNFTLSVYVAPTATPTPAPTAAPTHAPTSTPAHTSTPTPTPSPDDALLTTLTIVIIIVVVIAGVLTVALVLLRRRQAPM